MPFKVSAPAKKVDGRGLLTACSPLGEHYVQYCPHFRTKLNVRHKCGRDDHIQVHAAGGKGQHMPNS